MNHNRRVNSRWLSFLVWAAVAAGAAFWSLRLFVAPRVMPAQTVTVGGAELARGDLSRLFGSEEGVEPDSTSDVPAPSRFKLIGVVTPRREADTAVALALISIDDKPAKAYRVGAVVDGDNVLQEVRARGASLGPRDGPALALELPPPAPAATGTLPPPGMAPPLPSGLQQRPGLPAPVRMPPPQPPPIPDAPEAGGDGTQEFMPAPAVPLGAPLRQGGETQ